MNEELETELAETYEQYSNGEITQEEMNEAVDDLVESNSSNEG